MDSCSVVYSCDSVNHYGESLVPTAPIFCDFDIRLAGNIFKLTKNNKVTGNEDHFGNSTSLVPKPGLWLSSSSDLFQLQTSTKECTRDYILHRISLYIRKHMEI